jgi:hypothetical protein
MNSTAGQTHTFLIGVTTIFAETCAGARRAMASYSSEPIARAYASEVAKLVENRVVVEGGEQKFEGNVVGRLVLTPWLATKEGRRHIERLANDPAAHELAQQSARADADIEITIGVLVPKQRVESNDGQGG